MRYRLFGQTGLRVSELFLGAMTFGDPDGPGASLKESRRVLDAYADAGGNFVDTAVTYRGGASEEYLGELLAERRDRFVLATKYTLSRDGSDPNASGNHRKNLRLSLETSLRRLRTDHIDVYWVHIWDRNTPLEETMRALDDAVREGKILYVGISDAPSWVVARANTLAEWRGWTAFAGLQVPYSLLKRDIENELLPMAEALGLTVAAWSPLANGILSGKYNTGAATRTRLNPSQVSDHDLAVAKTVGEVADELGATSAQVALAWVRAGSPSVHPIIGARTAEQLADNLGVLDVTLEPDVVQRLNDASGFTRGFPMDFIDGTQGLVHGEVGAQVDNRH
ncbi:aldo/keto reductase [Actinomadura harenae]|uniref:Aldo/keto reductase n=1 Tax=Actinomadura harenae TaxID=2483351 RepID=A0A3M2MBF6_9ACTN|nr:aldo/keto reductase [Actinomadura harenae]RMI46849.1 aldo/keto reductase [Actinomadura harenae]